MQLNIYTNILNCVYNENNDALVIRSVDHSQTGVQFPFFGISFFVVGVVASASRLVEWVPLGVYWIELEKDDRLSEY